MFQSQVPLETMAASAEAAQYLAEKVRSSLGARASFEEWLRGLLHRERAILASAQ